MSDTWKTVIVLVINAVVAVLFAIAGEQSWDLAWYVPVTGVIVIVLDTLAGIKWIPPKRPSNDTGGSS